jgi:hypothetical protein
MFLHWGRGEKGWTSVKAVCGMVSILMLTQVVYADELATSASGRKVLLKDNGTWVGLGATAASNPSADDYSDTDSVIRAYCQSQWRTDFNMQSYCIKNQKAAIAVLLLGKPHDVSQDQFVSVRQECANQWETDFSMREYCEKQQYSAIRELKQ